MTPTLPPTPAAPAATEPLPPLPAPWGAMALSFGLLCAALRRRRRQAARAHRFTS